MPTHEQPAKIGKYEILSTLGRGGMGVVYKARDPLIDRIVAVKTILVGADASDDEGLLDRLHMEARSAGRLQHPNIVTVYDFGDQDQLSYIVMEYVEGVNLAKVIDERRPLPLDAKISILLQMADGLAYAHEHGVVHRDMKPSNVCITARGTAKILDFGLARFDNTRLTKTGYMAGTIAYMSPERLSGETGPQDDIFALGAIAYELLTYKRAFAGTMAPEVISKIIAPGPAPRPSDVTPLPPEVDVIVQKALAKDLDQRYESAAALAEDLRHLLYSDALKKYMTENGAATAARPIGEGFGVRPSANPYGAGSSGKTASGPPLPTLQVAASTQQATLIQSSGQTTQAAQPPTIVVADVKATGTHTQPEATQISGTPTQIAAAPTQVVQTPRKRTGAIAAVIAAAVILIGGGYFVFGHRPAPEKPVVPQPHTRAPEAPKPDPLAETSQLQLQTAKTLSDQVGRLTLSGDEIVRFTQAKTRIAAAQQKIESKDYEGGSRLVTDAIADLQSVLTSNGRHVQPPMPQPSPKPQPQPRPKPVPVQPQPLPVPVPVIPAPVPPSPQPQPLPQPQPRPVAESPEKQITAFMHQLEAAYQSKDVGFFREHALHFNDQFAAAIRNSPSVRVELDVESISVADPQHATVNVKRTDVFPDSNTPPAVQSLAYHLERTAGGWQLSSISRR